MKSSVRWVLITLLVTSRIGRSEVTVISSDVAASWRIMCTVLVWEIEMRTSSTVSSSKPSSVPVTETAPGSRAVTRNSPLTPVVVERSPRTSGPSTSIITPGSGSPFASRTSPRTVPTFWASAGAAMNRRRRETDSNGCIFDMATSGSVFADFRRQRTRTSDFRARKKP